MTKLYDPIEQLRPMLPRWLLRALDECGLCDIEEIRVRTGRPVQFTGVTGEALSDVVADEAMCEALLENLCEHSVAVRERELAQGFITVRGCRVGICGHAVAMGREVKRYSGVTGFNIRLAREVRDCALEAAGELYDGCGGVLSALVLSVPGAGKTTFLRDAARLLSEGVGGERGRKVCIADERSELAGAERACFDLGARTDVTDGCPKAEAMRALIRSMSPEVLITDEIGGDTDAEAVLYAASSGIAVIASAHARDESEAMRKPYLAALMRSGAFAKLIVLKRGADGFHARVTGAIQI